MIFGLTPEGFVLKRLADIKLELEQAFRAEFGAGLNLSQQSPFGQIVGIASERESKIWELAEAVYLSQNPDTAEGVSLDRVAALNGLTRFPATFSKVTGRIFGVITTVVPVNFTASVFGNSTARFKTPGTAPVGAGINEKQRVTFSPGAPTSGFWRLTFVGQQTANLAHNISAAALETALELLTTIDNVIVTGSVALGFDIEFTGAIDGQKDQPLMTVTFNTLSPAQVVTVTETTKGFLPFVDLLMQAEVVGPVQAPVGSLTVIETPIVGINSITNLLDADVGSNTETDQELRLRRADSLSRAGTATVDGIRNAILEVLDVDECVVVENPTGSVDGGGRPPKSFESVVRGGANQGIGDVIWNSKPAGIQSFGTVTVNVIDDLGNGHIVKFSRPTDLPIYIVVDIIANTNPGEGELYPLNGNVLVTQAILNFAATFTIGRDVIVNQFYTPINTVPGVVGITFKVGLAPGPTLSNNIPVSATQVATFDITRITVNS